MCVCTSVYDGVFAVCRICCGFNAYFVLLVVPLTITQSVCLSVRLFVRLFILFFRRSVINKNQSIRVPNTTLSFQK